MPITNGPNMSGRISLTSKFKRCVILGIVAVAAIFILDQLGLSTNPLAQKARRVARQPEQNQIDSSDCVYLKAPESFRGAQARHREAISRTTEAFSVDSAEAGLSLVQASDVPRKNIIDNILFDRMGRDGIASAPLCTDEEFIRRVYLDLTGNIPSPDDVAKFVQDQDQYKRDLLVDRLLISPEYVDKWTMFFGDLFRNTQFATNITLYFGGREAYYNYIKSAVAENKSYAIVAREMIDHNGDSFVNGEVNFIVLGNIPMGPAQDTMDGLAVRVATTFLGLSSMDCLLCHDGAGHLNAVNLWGAKVTRAEAWGMSAFFARTRRQTQRIANNYQKYVISENATGEYMLNTSSGNRQTRSPINGKNFVDPKYPFGGGGVGAGENRRQALSRLVVEDKQFARATVNYLWEEMMVEALVSPSNTFDLARLDPNAEMPAGWALQPANAQLLNALADEFRNSDFDIRHLVGLIAKSSAYQLSSKYPGAWTLEHVPYYARKFVRRLDAEEIHDAIVKATGLPPVTTYRDANSQSQTIIGFPIMDQANMYSRTVQRAMQLPDTVEPRFNGTSAAFMNSFLRGNRDSVMRSDDPSILQALNLMNSGFVMSRIHQGNRVALASQPEIPSTVRRLLADPNLTHEQIITQLFLHTLSRYPTDAEKAKLLPYFTPVGNQTAAQARQAATESIQWTLLNKVDFIFNY
ncbi:MAG: DUF1549 domain-containing protein [Blastocatellales bacterium]